VVAQICFITMRQLVIFLARFLSCENNQSPRHKTRAVATTPSVAKRSSAAPSVCSEPALSTAKGQALKDGATRPGKKHYASEGKAKIGREQGA
jgi:hypothetical protein